MVWEGKQLTPALTIIGNKRQIDEWKEAGKMFKTSSISTSTTEDTTNNNKWISPVEGQLKLNVDASVFLGAIFYSIGMILRDHNGQFLRGKSTKIVGSESVLEAEAVGMQEALSWLFEMTYQHITIETDALLVVNALHKNRQYQLEVGSVLEACRMTLLERNDVVVVHIRKLANKATHLMARVPCSLNSYKVFESSPTSLLETIVYESYSS